MASAREIVRAALADEQAWLGQHPFPALVFDLPGATVVDGDQPYFTREADTTLVPDEGVGETTDVLSAVQACAIKIAGEGVRPDTQIEWLVKSSRNPFGALITVGRTSTNDVVLAHTTVSKVHAIFSDAGKGAWMISDSGSSNGTFVDGVKLPPRERRSIEDGSEVRFGREIRARFVLPQSLLGLLQLARRTIPLGWV
jgi:hypothetical protein